MASACDCSHCLLAADLGLESVVDERGRPLPASRFVAWLNLARLGKGPLWEKREALTMEILVGFHASVAEDATLGGIHAGYS